MLDQQDKILQSIKAGLSHTFTNYLLSSRMKASESGSANDRNLRTSTSAALCAMTSRCGRFAAICRGAARQRHGSGGHHGGRGGAEWVLIDDCCSYYTWANMVKVDKRRPYCFSKQTIRKGTYNTTSNLNSFFRKLCKQNYFIFVYL